METNYSARNVDNAACGNLRNGGTGRFRFVIMAGLLCVAMLGLGGCAGDYYASGYGPSYYEPDYGSYYSDYGYDGSPYWGSGQYSGGEIIVGGVHHHGHYGGHHFVHQSSSLSARGPSMSRGPGGMRGGGRR